MDDPSSYCLACAEMISMLSGKDTAAFKLPCDVRFAPRNSHVARTAIWREGDHVELLHWTEQAPRHMIVRNTKRRRQARVRLCEPPLRPAVEKLTSKEDLPKTT